MLKTPMSEQESSAHSKHPRVFISYSHDSLQHSRRVLTFAQALRSNGIDVELDQFHQDEILDWPRWCSKQCSREQSDFILCVCTAEYFRRIEGSIPPERGRGVYWEGSLLDDEIYDAKRNRRILPVLFDDEAADAIPRFLRGWTFCRLGAFSLLDDGYEKMIRILTGQARVLKSDLGALPILPPKPPSGTDTTDTVADRENGPHRIDTVETSYAPGGALIKQPRRFVFGNAVLFLTIGISLVGSIATYRIRLIPYVEGDIQQKFDGTNHVVRVTLVNISKVSFRDLAFSLVIPLTNSTRFGENARLRPIPPADAEKDAESTGDTVRWELAEFQPGWRFEVRAEATDQCQNMKLLAERMDVASNRGSPFPSLIKPGLVALVSRFNILVFIIQIGVFAVSAVWLGVRLRIKGSQK